MKLAALTRRLGVSTGSFYHHFPDFETYLGELAENFSVDRVIRDINVANATPGATPVERMVALGRQSLNAGTFDLDRAMRIWGTMDERALTAIRRSEALVLGFITDAFAEMGFDRDQAVLRARILLSANVTPLQAPGHMSHGEFVRACLRVLVADPQKQVMPAKNAKRARSETPPQMTARDVPRTKVAPSARAAERGKARSRKKAPTSR